MNNKYLWLVISVIVTYVCYMSFSELFSNISKGYITLYFRTDGGYIPLQGKLLMISILLSSVSAWLLTIRLWQKNYSQNIILKLLVLPGIIYALFYLNIILIILALLYALTGNSLILG